MRRPPLAASAACVALVLLLSGCTTAAPASSGEPGADGPATLTYEGTGAGTDRGEPFPCAGNARVEAESRTTQGNTRVVVTDGAGDVVFDARGNSAGTEVHHLDATRDVTGAPGDWSITVHRLSTRTDGSGWFGQYTVTVQC